MSPNPFQPELLTPTLFEASNQALGLNSVLRELSLYQFQVESHRSGKEIAQVLERYPAVSGVIVLEQGQFLGMISRQRLLEYLIRPHGLEIFLAQPLTTLYSYARSPSLILPDSTPILVAAQQALRRSPLEQSEPIVVQIDSHICCLLEIHELNIAHWQLRGIETQVRYERAQTQMIQIEKMASLGRLVDGVAHEILDPVSFIWGNLTHVSDYVEQLMTLVAAYEDQLPQPSEAIANLQAEIELDYLRQDLPQSIGSIKAGAERLKRLAASLQNFCHVDDVYPKPADLHECLDSILLLLKSRLTGDIQIVREYSHLPPVTCYAGQLSQVFINILTNAIDVLINHAVHRELVEELGGALSNSRKPLPPQPQITITTQVRTVYSTAEPAAQTCQEAPILAKTATRWVSIRIANNGPCLTDEQQQQIINSFSIEQRAAKETSLAVSYRIITAKHDGKLYVRSGQDMTIADATKTKQTEGTEFEILLPLL